MPAQYTCVRVGAHVQIVGSWCAFVVKGRGFCLQLSWEVSPLSSPDGALCPRPGLLMLAPYDLILSGEFKHVYLLLVQLKSRLLCPNVCLHLHVGV